MELHESMITPPRKKNYFDNDAVTKAILEYKEGLALGKDNIRLLHPYTLQIQQLVRGVINTHKIYRWWNDLDELIQEGMLAVYSSFQRFDPVKGTAFNYLSITVKNHLKNWTQSKNKKSWITGEFNDEIFEEEGQSHTDDMMTIERLFFEVKIPENLEHILMAIMNTITKDRIYNKRDVIKQLLKAGHSKKDIEATFTELENHFGTFMVDNDETE